MPSAPAPRTHRSIAPATCCACALLLGACASPLDLVREKPEDLARRLPAERLSGARALNLADFRRAQDSGAPRATDAGATGALPAEQEARTVTWSLADALAQSLQGNLALRAALFEPTIAQEAENAERAKFEAVFTPRASFASNDPATTNTTASNQSQALSASGAVTVPLRTGGRAVIDMAGSFSRTGNPFFTSPSSYGGGVGASLSIPLLRGAGRRVNSLSILVAGYQADLSQLRTRLQVIGTLAGTERAYWRLVAAGGELEVRQRQLELAQDQLGRAERLVQAGSAAQIEITRARSGVAQRLGAIIGAQTEVQIAQRDLRRAVGDPGAPVDAPINVQTSTPPEAQALDLPAQPLLDMALANRTELLQTELELIVDALQIEQAQDATRPGLTATADYNFDGVGTEARRALRRVLNADFQTWSIGLAGEVPLEGNLSAQARLRQAMLTRAQRLASEQSQRQSVRQEVLDAIDRVNSAWQRILAAQQSALLAGETLDAERRQFEAGLRTSTDVLSAASSLADAQSQEIRALTDHRLALVDLAVATGTVLGAAGITWSHLPEPPLGEVTPAPAVERDPALRPPQAPETEEPH